MPWARFHDQALTDEKLLVLSDAAWRLWGCALVYCGNRLTDGLVPDTVLTTFGVKGNLQKAIQELCAPCRAGREPLWARVEGGYQVHDYLQWNMSRDQALAERARKLRHWHGKAASSGPSTSASSSASSRPSSDASSKPSSKPSSRPSSDASLARSHPHPHVSPPTEGSALTRTEAAKKEKPKSSEDELPPEVHVAIRRYHELFVATVGRKPRITGRDGRTFKELIAEQGLDDVLAALDGFFVNEYAAAATFPLSLFEASYNKYRGAAKPTIITTSEREIEETARRMREREAKWTSAS